MNLTGMTPLAAGQYGAYFNIGDGRGMKVLGINCYGNEHYHGAGSPSKHAAKTGSYWSEAVREAKGIRASECSGLTPKLFGVTLVEYKGLFYTAIVMEHINGERLADAVVPKEINKWDISRAVYDRLQMFGVGREDLHDANILFTEDCNAYAIDFSPTFFSYQLREKVDKIADEEVILEPEPNFDKPMHLDMNLDDFRLHQSLLTTGSERGRLIEQEINTCPRPSTRFPPLLESSLVPRNGPIRTLSSLG